MGYGWVCISFSVDEACLTIVVASRCTQLRYTLHYYRRDPSSDKNEGVALCGGPIATKTHRKCCGMLWGRRRSRNLECPTHFKVYDNRISFKHTYRRARTKPLFVSLAYFSLNHRISFSLAPSLVERSTSKHFMSISESIAEKLKCRFRFRTNKEVLYIDSLCVCVWQLFF